MELYTIKSSFFTFSLPSSFASSSSSPLPFSPSSSPSCFSPPPTTTTTTATTTTTTSTTTITTTTASPSVFRLSSVRSLVFSHFFSFRLSLLFNAITGLFLSRNEKTKGLEIGESHLELLEATLLFDRDLRLFNESPRFTTPLPVILKCRSL